MTENELSNGTEVQQLNGWDIIGNTIKRNKARADYNQSVKDTRNAYLDYANEIDNSNIVNDAQQEAATRNENAIKQNISLNQLNQGTVTSKALNNLGSDFSAQYQKVYNSKKAERDVRNQNIIAAKEQATEEAKAKYAQAQQALATSWTNWQNTFKTVTAFIAAFV